MTNHHARLASASRAVIYEAEATKYAALAAAEEQRLSSLQRISEAVDGLDRLITLYPGRSSMGEVLAGAGKAPADLGLKLEDMPVLEEMFAELPTG